MTSIADMNEKEKQELADMTEDEIREMVDTMLAQVQYMADRIAVYGIPIGEIRLIEGANDEKARYRSGMRESK